MAWPKGVSRKSEKEPEHVDEVVEVVGDVSEVPEVAPVDTRMRDAKGGIVEPLGPGQRYFETPDGEIIIAESDKDHVWARNMNGGKGGWANPRR